MLDLDSYVSRSESPSNTGLDPKNNAAPGTPGSFTHSVHEKELSEPKEIVNSEVNELTAPKEVSAVTSVAYYPEGTLVCKVPEGMPKLNISEPSSDYPFEDFELKVIHTYDNGMVVDSNRMILGWRGSIKHYVNICDSDYNRLDGFSQKILKKDGTPMKNINIYVKYHDENGNIITPIFSKDADNVTEEELKFSL